MCLKPHAENSTGPAVARRAGQERVIYLNQPPSLPCDGGKDGGKGIVPAPAPPPLEAGPGTDVTSSITKKA